MAMVPTVGYDAALTILNNAVRLIEADGKKANIFIMDQTGQTIASVRMEGTRNFTHGVAYRKASQAATTGERTRTLRDRVNSDDRKPGDYNISPEEFIESAGGVPIYDQEGNLLGGIGISNLSEDEDEQYAVKAVESVGLLSDRPAR